MFPSIVNNLTTEYEIIVFSFVQIYFMIYYISMYRKYSYISISNKCNTYTGLSYSLKTIHRLISSSLDQISTIHIVSDCSEKRSVLSSSLSNELLNGTVLLFLVFPRNRCITGLHQFVEMVNKLSIAKTILCEHFQNRPFDIIFMNEN